MQMKVRLGKSVEKVRRICSDPFPPGVDSAKKLICLLEKEERLRMHSCVVGSPQSQGFRHSAAAPAGKPVEKIERMRSAPGPLAFSATNESLSELNIEEAECLRQSSVAGLPRLQGLPRSPPRTAVTPDQGVHLAPQRMVSSPGGLTWSGVHQSSPRRTLPQRQVSSPQGVSGRSLQLPMPRPQRQVSSPAGLGGGLQLPTPGLSLGESSLQGQTPRPSCKEQPG